MRKRTLKIVIALLVITSLACNFVLGLEWLWRLLSPERRSHYGDDAQHDSIAFPEDSIGTASRS